MKRPYLLAASLLALTAIAATSACHRNDRVGTTNTTSATVTTGEPSLQVGRSAPNTDATPGVKTAESPAITPADLPNAPSIAAPGAAKGGSAAAAPATADTATSTAPVDISGPTPAVPTEGNSTATPAVADNAARSGNANATSTTTTPGAPLVAPGLDNGVSGGASNTGAPLNYGMGTEPWFGPAPVTTRPVGGAMRPGAASDPNTTSGAR
jgi:hypothetical protein